MVFSTYIFIFYFLPAVLLGYYALPSFVRRFGAPGRQVTAARNGFLLAASCVFYGWWNPWFVLLLLFVAVSNYLCGLIMTRPGASPRQRVWGLTVAVALDLGTLGFFKYFMFLQTNLNQALSWLGADRLRVLDIALPMGVSFYTFKALGYIFDVYREAAPPARTLRDFACYVALYPQLEAGPIERYAKMAGPLADRTHTWQKFASGVALFILGFAKKVLLANPVGEIATTTFSAQSLTTGDAWVGAAAYAFQIYFDFSGYSDMAVGLGRMIGFEFMKNFNSPYQAESITDFWRRWHLSLSSWFRDYVFLPLEMATRDHPNARRRQAVNLMLMMLLVGLWHGAGWTFVAWGAYHGAWMVLEQRRRKDGFYQRLPRPARLVTTFVLVTISWVLFRSDTFPQALEYLKTMFGVGGGGDSALLLAAQLYGQGQLVLMALCAVLLLCPWQAHDWSANLTWPKALALAPAMGWTLLYTCA